MNRPYSTIRLCRDCRFFHDALCHHKSSYEFSVVTGEASAQYAAVMRMDAPDRCGPLANDFEVIVPPASASAPRRYWPWSRA